MRPRTAVLAACCLVSAAASAAAQTAAVEDLGHGIYRAAGVMGGTAVRVPQSNTFMIVTRDGNVIVDTSAAAAAPAHKRALTAVNGGPVKAIILTHAHGDHTGGVAQWRQPGTEIIAQRLHEDFMAYQLRRRGYFARSNAAQFGLGAGGGGAVGAAATSPVPPTVRYVGWYDGNVSTMFGPPSQGYAEIVTLAGGPDAVAARAKALAESDAVHALYLTDMALAADGRHRAALEARLAALRWLDAHSGNSNERGGLAAGIRDAAARLKP